MVFNGTTTALKEKPLTARTGETIRIFFGVGGPNLTSSFHVIGNVVDRVYAMGSVVPEPLRNIQTVGTPPGSAIIADFRLEAPGDYVIVDHALSRVERGLSGLLRVEGAENPEVFSGG
jgi:nitrite reductase (NO-forming)